MAEEDKESWQDLESWQEAEVTRTASGESGAEESDVDVKEETEESEVEESDVSNSVVGEFIVEECFTETETPPIPRKRFWLHCCLIFCIIIVILIAILVPVLLLVAFPSIAQASLNGSKLEFTTINITEPGNSSFFMHNVGRVSNAGPFGAYIHFPEPISVYWQVNDSSLLLGNITMDDLNVGGGVGSIDSTTNFTVANITTFTNFNSYLLSAPKFSWRLVGVADVSALGRAANGLKLDKTVDYLGMGGFPSLKIRNITLPVTNTPSKGIEIDMLVEMDNPSPLGIQLGDVNLRLEYEGTTLGPASISNFFMSAGVNLVPIKTILLPQSSAEGSAHVSDLLSKFIQNIPADTLSYGLSAYPNRRDPIVWLTPAIQNLVLNVSFIAPDIATLNSTAKSFAQSSINGASLRFNTIEITNETAVNFMTSLDVFLNNTGPLSASIQFPEPVKIFSKGLLLGSVTMPSVDVANGSGRLVGQSSTFSIDDPVSFGEFTKTLLATDSFEWTLVGNVSATALNRTFTGLTLNKTVTLNGMGGFKDINIQKFNLPSNAKDGGISMEISSSLYNPSPIGVQLGVVSFLISYKNVVIGPVNSAPGFFLAPGNNTLNLTGKMIEQTDLVALNTLSSLLSLYVAGTTVMTTVQGESALPDGINQVAWLEAGIKSLTLNVSLNNVAGGSYVQT